MIHHFNEEKWRITRIAIDSEPELVENVVTNVENPEIEYKFSTALIDGIPSMPCCPQSRYENLNQNIKYRSDDIIVCTYPKCGTTWMEQCVLLMKNGADPTFLNPADKNSYHQETGFGKFWPEAMILQDKRLDGGQFRFMTWEEFDNAPSPRVIKAHFPVNLLLGAAGKGLAGLPEGVKVVIVSRNPYDGCVSSYYHAFNPYEKGWPFDAWATAWINGYPQYGDYFEWVKGWYKSFQENRDRAIWIKFEDLKKDSLQELTKVANFLQIPQANDLNFMQKVNEYSSFRSMKDQSLRKGGDKHLRKGTVGDWKNHFTPEITEIFQKRINEEFGNIPELSHQIELE